MSANHPTGALSDTQSMFCHDSSIVALSDGFTHDGVR